MHNRRKQREQSVRETPQFRDVTCIPNEVFKRSPGEILAEISLHVLGLRSLDLYLVNYFILDYLVSGTIL